MRGALGAPLPSSSPCLAEGTLRAAGLGAPRPDARLPPRSPRPLVAGLTASSRPSAPRATSACTAVRLGQGPAWVAPSAASEGPGRRGGRRAGRQGRATSLGWVCEWTGPGGLAAPELGAGGVRRWGGIRGGWQFPASPLPGPRPPRTHCQRPAREDTALSGGCCFLPGQDRICAGSGVGAGRGRAAKQLRLPEPGFASTLCSPEPSAPRGACPRLPPAPTPGGPGTRLHLRPPAGPPAAASTFCPRGGPLGGSARVMRTGHAECPEGARLPVPAWAPPPPGTDVGERAGGSSQRGQSVASWEASAGPEPPQPAPLLRLCPPRASQGPP